MPEPNTPTPQAGADAGRAVEDRRSRARAQPSGAADGITVTRWSLGLSLTIALTVVTAAFTLVWNQTLTLGETQMHLVASVSGLDARVTGLETEVRGLRAEMHEEIGGLRAEMREEIGGLRAEMREEIGGLRAEMSEEIGGLRGEIRELADLIRDRPGPPSR